MNQGINIGDLVEGALTEIVSYIQFEFICPFCQNEIEGIFQTEEQLHEPYFGEIEQKCSRCEAEFSVSDEDVIILKSPKNQ